MIKRFQNLKIISFSPNHHRWKMYFSLGLHCLLFNTHGRYERLISFHSCKTSSNNFEMETQYRRGVATLPWLFDSLCFCIRMLHWYNQTDAGMQYKHAGDLSYMHLAEKNNNQDSCCSDIAMGILQKM
jgi:hypothetical protein